LPRLVSDIGHIILQVGDMDKAIKLYRDTLGFDLKEHSPEWSVLATKLGELTLYKTPKITPLVLRGADVTPINLHVVSFEDAADQLEKNGYSVKRKGKNSGTLTDRWGNLLELHDHRKA
jgi:catechol 2,3-dioxygenase-like lactoylglutathione lyase family enzyme